MIGICREARVDTLCVCVCEREREREREREKEQRACSVSQTCYTVELMVVLLLLLLPACLSAPSHAFWCTFLHDVFPRFSSYGAVRTASVTSDSTLAGRIETHLPGTPQVYSNARWPLTPCIPSICVCRGPDAHSHGLLCGRAALSNHCFHSHHPAFSKRIRARATSFNATQFFLNPTWRDCVFCCVPPVLQEATEDDEPLPDSPPHLAGGRLTADTRTTSYMGALRDEAGGTAHHDTTGAGAAGSNETSPPPPLPTKATQFIEPPVKKSAADPVSCPRQIRVCGARRVHSLPLDMH